MKLALLILGALSGMGLAVLGCLWLLDQALGDYIGRNRSGW